MEKRIHEKNPLPRKQPIILYCAIASSTVPRFVRRGFFNNAVFVFFSFLVRAKPTFLQFRPSTHDKFAFVIRTGRSPIRFADVRNPSPARFRRGGRATISPTLPGRLQFALSSRVETFGAFPPPSSPPGHRPLFPPTRHFAPKLDL